METLQEHIKQAYNSNHTWAAREFNTSRTNLYSWIDRGAIVIEGVIYCPAMKNPATKTN